MQKLVSVLMCVYNTPKDYLREAIESVLNQTYRCIEFLIVDDGSDHEDTLSLLEYYKNKDSRIVIIRNPANLGLTKSLNIGLRQTKGEYIARMDADDVSIGDRFEKQVEYLDNHEDIALVGSSIITFSQGISDRDNVISKNGCEDPNRYLVNSLFHHPGPAHPTFMLRKAFLAENNICYNEIIKKGQDYGIIADILRKDGKIYTLDEPLLKYRVHQAQITTSSELEQLLYQSKTSYEYIKEVFPILSREECTVISTLGWYVEGDAILNVIEMKEDLVIACEHLLFYKNSLSRPDVYISAIKKMLHYNRERDIYDPKILNEVLKILWWKKAIRMTELLKKPWGIRLFTFICYFYVARKRENAF